MRLTETRAGAILLDGRDCRTVPLLTLRSAVGVVPQTPFLFQVLPSSSNPNGLEAFSLFLKVSTGALATNITQRASLGRRCKA